MRSTKLMMLVALTVLICGIFSTVHADKQEKAADVEGHAHTLGDIKSVPVQLNYQGYLANSADSSAVTSTLEMTFRLFDVETKGVELWSETHLVVEVQGGLFQVLLGSVTAFPTDLFDGSPLWLQTEVGPEVLAPRKPLVSVAYSQRTVNADHAMMSDEAVFAAEAAFAAESQHAVHADTAAYSPMAGAWTVSGDDVYRESGLVGIGTIDPTEKLDVAGNIQASGTITSWSGITIDGERDRIASGGDLELHVGSERALKLQSNPSSPNLIGGYSGNSVTDGVSGAVIGGGGQNGSINSVTGSYSTVGGGHGNTASSDRAFVGGGQDNTASSSFATAVGGWANEAGSPYATVGGGSNNHADGQYAVVSGGNFNAASGSYAMVLGGDQNVAAGDHGFAAGHRAQADHNGAFVWADETEADFASTGENQYLIRATGGVGIGTTSPTHALDVNGDVNAMAYYGDGSHLTGISGTTDNDWTIAGDNIYHQTGNVGIGTTAPERQLHIKGANPRILIEASSINPEVNFRNTDDAGPETWAMYKQSITDDLRFYQSGDKLTIKNNTGYVGIGTVDPISKLHIQEQAWPTYVTIESTDDYAPGIIFREGGENHWWLFYHPVDSVLCFFREGYGNRVTFRDSGFVDIDGPLHASVVSPMIAIEGHCGVMPPMSFGGGIGVMGTFSSDGVTGVGVYGEATTAMSWMGNHVGVYGMTDADNGYGVYYEGGLGGVGVKSSIVDTKDYGWRQLYTLESPGNWFEDFGQARLVDGQATVTIDPVFAQTVDLSQVYHVFLTPLGDCGLYVAEKSPAAFTVKALGEKEVNIAFDYRIVAKRRGYEDRRLEAAVDPEQIRPQVAHRAMPR